MAHLFLRSLKEEVAKLSFSESGVVVPAGDEGSCFHRRGVIQVEEKEVNEMQLL